MEHSWLDGNGPCVSITFHIIITEPLILMEVTEPLSFKLLGLWLIIKRPVKINYILQV